MGVSGMGRGMYLDRVGTMNSTCEIFCIAFVVWVAYVPFFVCFLWGYRMMLSNTWYNFIEWKQ